MCCTYSRSEFKATLNLTTDFLKHCWLLNLNWENLVDFSISLDVTPLRHINNKQQVSTGKERMSLPIEHLSYSWLIFHRIMSLCPQAPLPLLGLADAGVPASLKHQSHEISVNQSGCLGLWIVCHCCLFIRIEPIPILTPLHVHTVTHASNSFFSRLQVTKQARRSLFCHAERCKFSLNHVCSLLFTGLDS